MESLREECVECVVVPSTPGSRQLTIPSGQDGGGDSTRKNKSRKEPKP